LCEFLELEFDDKLMDASAWHDRLPKGLLINPRSAHGENNIRGFSVERTKNWAKNLEDWEISLIEYLCLPWMEKYNYEVHSGKNTAEDAQTGLEKMAQSSLLKERVDHLLSTGEGTPLYYNDPTDPKNWAAARNNIAAKFTDAEKEDSESYFDGLQKIEDKLNTMYGDD